ncbi:type VI secretion system lipoprotein TssJ [Scandinavium goeteborgense]|uniref:type VI secretion system lipoprotein TssJ n=1 Tax=Scandinavium goeteborgense TaxID=1851514 RepID=UPI00380B828C
MASLQGLSRNSLPYKRAVTDKTSLRANRMKRVKIAMPEFKHCRPTPKLKFLTLLYLVVVILLQACSSSEKNSGTKNILVNLVSTPQTNLDNKGQATPINVTVYQLKSADNFQNSDYFTLVEGNDALLSNDIVKFDSVILKPGEMRVMNIIPQADVTALGFIAAFREIDSADWQKIYILNTEDTRAWYQKMRSKKTIKLDVNFEGLAISLKELE